MSRDRGFRRHQVEKMKRRVLGYYGGHAKGKPRIIGLYAGTPQICSCPMCGNPRRHFEAVTMQEVRADIALRDEEVLP